MPSIAERKRRKQESAVLRQARLDLLAELERLEDQVCDECKRPVSGAQFTCDCPAATRMRDIGQELSILINERTKIEVSTKEVKKVAKKNKTPEITEEAVNEMKESGMTYAAIAKHFGISAPTLATRRQNWELERVRAQRQEGKSIVKPPKNESVVKPRTAQTSAAPSHQTTYETQIKELKEAVRFKDDIIQEQQDVIDQLKVERDELANRSEPSNEWQKEIRDERKLLAILLERESARIKNLMEVG